MTLETALAAIVTAQKASSLTPEAFYTALSRLAAMDHMLRTALVPGSYTIGKANPLQREPVIEPLREPAAAAQASGEPVAVAIAE